MKTASKENQTSVGENVGTFVEWRKRLLRKMRLVFALFVIVLAVSYLLPEIASFQKTYVTVSEVPKNSVGLVFGTSQYLWTGQKNAFFTARMRAAAELYREGRVDCLLVSGDNATESYNETRAMQVALMGLWVPPERIIPDYAGFRTLDSVYRAVLVFGQKRFTVVTQSFQSDRALLLAASAGADAVAYAADAPGFFVAPGTYFREIFARPLALYDLFLGKTYPKYLWDPIRIETDPSVRPVPEKICFPR